MNHRNEVQRIYAEALTLRVRARLLLRDLARIAHDLAFAFMVRRGLVLELFGTTFANDELKLIYQATAIANIADNASSSPLTNIYASLHTGSPASGNQQTSEVSYTGYARQAMARSSAAFTITGASMSFVNDVVFPVSSSGTPTVTHFALGSVVSATGKVIDSGTVTPNIVVSTSVAQTLAQGSTITRT